ncbi:hypothetical protein IMZ48_26830 [Candidatus Bathyarchaeota archaeon]|nr:hypothetical protein [Candidatus Bathyarchaeota archaeon]
MAEWVMKNGDALNLKYVIWGQRIWNPSQDKQGDWTSWRGMEDRGDVTQNHWYVESIHTLLLNKIILPVTVLTWLGNRDHVHVSFN